MALQVLKGRSIYSFWDSLGVGERVALENVQVWARTRGGITGFIPKVFAWFKHNTN